MELLTGTPVSGTATVPPGGVAVIREAHRPDPGFAGHGGRGGVQAVAGERWGSSNRIALSTCRATVATSNRKGLSGSLNG
ncbi:hypothetical protein [Streptomyces sp. CA-210063]|uniref:hypothetical protein n=1 Tax=Streptomyces sp. CA-210063 TaxID=2801029 RepID=UPI002F3FE744